MREITYGRVYDTDQSTVIVDDIRGRNQYYDSDSKYSLWKTANGSYFMLDEKLSKILRRLTGVFRITSLSADKPYDILHECQLIDVLRKEFSDRVHDA